MWLHVPVQHVLCRASFVLIPLQFIRVDLGSQLASGFSPVLYGSEVHNSHMLVGPPGPLGYTCQLTSANRIVGISPR